MSGAPVSIRHSQLSWTLDIFLPPQEREPDAVRRYRFLAGGALLGLVVTSLSLVVQLAIGPAQPVPFLIAYAGAMVGLLVASRFHAPLRVLSVCALAVVGAFLFAMALITVEMDYRQLQWLVLLPLIALLLGEPPSEPDARPLVSFLGMASGLAAVLGLAIIVSHRVGWTFGQTDTSSPDVRDVAGTVDFLLFLVSVTGLLRLHDLTLRKAQEEVARLRSILSICAWCGRLHDDDEGWVPIERYMTKHTSSQLSHGICPTCVHQVEKAGR